jgi:hypothetical protein
MSELFKDLDYRYPTMRFRIRREVYEWLKTKGGVDFLKKMLYSYYDKVAAVDKVASKRNEHLSQFQQMRKGETHED